MNNIYIIIPAYNESKNIESCVNDWYPVIERNNEGGTNSKLVIIDDGSKDNTFDILNNLAKTRPNLISLAKPNGGHGSTVLFGYKYAIDNNADYIFQTDSDGQTNPDEFEDFWKLRNEYDGVFGNRTIRGDGKQRAFVEKVVCFLIKLFFNVDVPDANAPFRLMKASTLKKYLNKIPADYNLPNIMITTYFSYYKEKIIFKEISFKPRQAGKNSINITKIFRIGLKALKDFYSFRKNINKENN